MQVPRPTLLKMQLLPLRRRGMAMVPWMLHFLVLSLPLALPCRPIARLFLLVPELALDPASAMLAAHRFVLAANRGYMRALQL